MAFVSEADGLSHGGRRQRHERLRARPAARTRRSSSAAPTGRPAPARTPPPFEPSISQDGRYVAFRAPRPTSSPGASPGVAHVYVRDLVDGTTTAVDRADGPNGAIAERRLRLDPSITVKAGQARRRVLQHGDEPRRSDRRRSPAGLRARRRHDPPRWSAGATPNGAERERARQRDSLNASISTDGTTVAFESSCDQPASPGTPTATTDVFVRTRAGYGTVSQEPAPLSNGDSASPSISGDGRAVAFVSSATNLSGSATPTLARRRLRRDCPTRDHGARQPRQRRRPATKGHAVPPEAAISDDGDASSSAPRPPTWPRRRRTRTASSDMFVRDWPVHRDADHRASSAAPSPALEADGASVHALDLAHARGARQPAPSRSRPPPPTWAPTTRTTSPRSTCARSGGVGPVERRALHLAADGHRRLPQRRQRAAPCARRAARVRRRRPRSAPTGATRSSCPPRTSSSAEDDDNLVNVFRRDNLTGETVLVSRADGPAGRRPTAVRHLRRRCSSRPGCAGAPAISANGNRIAFTSAGDEPGRRRTPTALSDVFVRDVAAGTTDARQRAGGRVARSRCRRATRRSAATATASRS